MFCIIDKYKPEQRIVDSIEYAPFHDGPLQNGPNPSQDSTKLQFEIGYFLFD